jgi:GNAT superfamily N-acetyltransferase
MPPGTVLKNLKYLKYLKILENLKNDDRADTTLWSAESTTRPPPCCQCYPHHSRRTRLFRPLISTGPHRHRSSEYGRRPGVEADLQNWAAHAFMVCRMFRIEAEIDKTRRDLLRSRLRDTNTAASPVLAALRGTPDEREVPLHIWALDASGGLAGGLVGHTWAAWLHLTYLWVDTRHRRAGLGARLLMEAERLAAQGRGCRAARVETWDFQAPEFYQKQGFEVVCVIPDYPPGVTEYTLTKRLIP